MTEWEKAEAGLLYDAHMDEKIVRGRRRSQELNYDYNALRPCQFEERDKMIRDNFRKVGKHCVIEQPFHGDFWERISVGDNFFANPCRVIREIKPLDDDVVLHAAPATKEPVPELTEAFIVPKGTMVKLNVGVWHLAAMPIHLDTVHVMITLPERIYKSDCVAVEYQPEQYVKIEL